MKWETKKHEKKLEVGGNKINFPRETKRILDHIRFRLDRCGYRRCEECGRWGFGSVVDACQSNVTAKKTYSIWKSVSDAGFKIMQPHSCDRGAGRGWNSGDSWMWQGSEKKTRVGPTDSNYLRPNKKEMRNNK